MYELNLIHVKFILPIFEEACSVPRSASKIDSFDEGGILMYSAGRNQDDVKAIHAPYHILGTK